MEIVDAQIHGLTPVTDLGDAFTAEQVLVASAELAVASMDAVGVSAAIVNSRMPYVRAYLTRYPDRFAGLPFIGFPEPEPDDVHGYVAELAAIPSVIGVRLVVGIPDDGSRVALLQQGAFDGTFSAARHHGLPVFVTAHGFLPALHNTLRRFSDLMFVLDHVGLQTPPRRYQPSPTLFEELPHVLDLAQYPNVLVKFTGVPSLSSQPYPFADVWPYMHKLLDAFGIDRCMWGSDFTRCKPLHTYREAVDFLLLTDEVSAADKETLFSGSIRRWLRWSTDSLSG